MSEKTKTGWIRYEYWAKGSHSKDMYLFIGDTEGMEEDDVFEHILDHEGNWARYAEQFRAEWDTDVVPPKNVIERELKVIDSRIEALKVHRERLEKFL